MTAYDVSDPAHGDLAASSDDRGEQSPSMRFLWIYLHGTDEAGLPGVANTCNQYLTRLSLSGWAPGYGVAGTHPVWFSTQPCGLERCCMASFGRSNIDLQAPDIHSTPYK